MKMIRQNLCLKIATGEGSPTLEGEEAAEIDEEIPISRLVTDEE